MHSFPKLLRGSTRHEALVIYNVGYFITSFFNILYFVVGPFLSIYMCAV